MAKDKKASKDKKESKEKKASKSKSSGGGGAASKLKRIAENPVVADVVAAALVATASALKDSKKAQAFAAAAGDEIEKLAKKQTRDGAALWGMALEIGRSALESFSTGGGGETKSDSDKPAGKKRKSGKAVSKSR